MPRAVSRFPGLLWPWVTLWETLAGLSLSGPGSARTSLPSSCPLGPLSSGHHCLRSAWASVGCKFSAFLPGHSTVLGGTRPWRKAAAARADDARPGSSGLPALTALPPHPDSTSSSLSTSSLDSTAAPQGLAYGTESPLPGSLSPLEPHLLPFTDPLRGPCTKLLLTSGLLPAVCYGGLTQASAPLRKPPAVGRQGPWALCTSM